MKRSEIRGQPKASLNMRYTPHGLTAIPGLRLRLQPGYNGCGHASTIQLQPRAFRRIAAPHQPALAHMLLPQ